MIRPPPRSTLFPTRRSSDLGRASAAEGSFQADIAAAVAAIRAASRAERARRARRRSVACRAARTLGRRRSEEHTSELQSQSNLVCRLLLEKKKPITHRRYWR